MKKLALFSIMFVLITSIVAQNDTTKIDFGKSKILIIRNQDNPDLNDTLMVLQEDGEFISTPRSSTTKSKKHKKRFNSNLGGIGFGINGYLSPSQNIVLTGAEEQLSLNYGRSWLFYINGFEFNIPVIKNQAGFASALGLEFNNYFFDYNIVFSNSPTGLLVSYDTINKFKKNKLVVPVLTMPLIFEFQVPTKDKKIHVGVGAIGGLRIGSHTKQVYYVDGNKIKDKTRGSFNLNYFRYSLTARVGYGKTSLFANYTPTALFKEGKGPELYPWAAGIHLAF